MRCPERGFTLVEVMVALAIVALSVPALLFTLDQQIDGTAYLRDRELAQLVASNRLGELRLAALAGRPLERGSAAGEEEMLGRRWFWRVDSEATGAPGFQRIEVRVRAGAEAEAPVLATLAAFFADVDADPAGPG